jgi:serine/threonine protein kinase
MSDKDDWEQHLKEEVGVMKRLSHPNILKVLDQMGNRGRGLDLAHRAEEAGIKESKRKGKEKEQEQEQDLSEEEQGWDWGAKGIWKAHMVFELAAGGDLFSYCESNGRSKGLTEEETEFLAWQLILGIEHIHSRGIVHRGQLIHDIVPCNDESKLTSQI